MCELWRYQISTLIIGALTQHYTTLQQSQNKKKQREKSGLKNKNNKEKNKFLTQVATEGLHQHPYSLVFYQNETHPKVETNWTPASFACQPQTRNREAHCVRQRVSQNDASPHHYDPHRLEASYL